LGMSSRPIRPALLLMACALVVLTLAVYWPVSHHAFVSLDDPAYVTLNPHVLKGLTWEGVRWAFSTGSGANWHPLTWLSHMLDVSLFGPEPGGHHVTSLLLHILNTLLLFAWLARATGQAGRSLFVAALFAVHPLHVESVAWVSERKDVLSTAFAFLALWFYTDYARSPRWWRYGLVLGCLALGLLAKQMLVTLPLLLLLVDVWPLGRWHPAGETGRQKRRTGRPRWAGLVIEKVPLLGLAAAASVAAFVAQRHGGTVADLAVVPLDMRIGNALISCVAYLRGTVWPAGLAAFYPYPLPPIAAPALAAACVLAAASFAAIRLSGPWRPGRVAPRRPYLLVGWLWYLVTLVPVIGLVQIGLQARADRYTYVPMIGLAVVAAWGAVDLAARWRVSWRVVPLLACGVCLACVPLARSQVDTWATSESLWRHALAVNPGNYYAHSALGAVLSVAGRQAEAVQHLEESARLAPWYPDPHAELGDALAAQGKPGDAVPHYMEALRLAPASAEAHNGVCAALTSLARAAEGLGHCEEAVRLKPDMALFHCNLAAARADLRDLDGAVSEFREAIARRPHFPGAYTGLGAALAGRGDTAGASDALNEALRQDPRAVGAHVNLGMLAFAQGRVDDAIASFRRALAMEPDNADGLNNLGGALVVQGKLDEAAACYRAALRRAPGRAELHNNLGFALAAGGRAADAIPEFAEAIRLQPNLEAAHLYLAWALAAAGRRSDAVLQFQEVLRINPSSQKAREGLTALLRGRGQR